MPITRFSVHHTAAIVVDIQDKLVAAMHEPTAFVRQAGRLVDGLRILGVPIVVTEHYRKGLGATVPELATKLGIGDPAGAAARGGSPVTVHEKLLFSACTDAVRGDLARAGAKGVIVCGNEAHVCVLQTCLDLVEAGYAVALVADAISSRRPHDRDVAIQRMIQSGVTPTTVESILFELVREAGTPAFKAVLPIVK